VIGIINNRQAKRSQRRQKGRGQSLLEFALTMPVLLTIMAGVLEVGNLLVTYNRVQLAAREASRFGAAGGASEFVPEIVLDASTDSLDTSPDRMSVYVIRPVVEYSSGAFRWKDSGPGNPWGVPEDCVYGNDCSGSGLNAANILTEVSQIVSGTAQGATSTNVQDLNTTRVTIVVVSYEAQTILNLNFWDTGADAQGRVPLRAYTILRQEIEQEVIGQQTAGCTAYPIAINRDLFYPGGVGVMEGDKFTAGLNYETSDTDGFEFLAWRVGLEDATSLTNALTYPGNSIDPTVGFQNVDDPSDTQMHRDDRLTDTNVHSVSSVQSVLSSFIDSNPLDTNPWRVLRVIVYDADGPNPDNTAYGTTYRIDDFAIVKITKVNNPTPNTVQFEFVRWDFSCGYDADF
jgi:hypothetical protein